jgi:hypothetical protein
MAHSFTRRIIYTVYIITFYNNILNNIMRKDEWLWIGFIWHNICTNSRPEITFCSPQKLEFLQYFNYHRFFNNDLFHSTSTARELVLRKQKFNR